MSDSQNIKESPEKELDLGLFFRLVLMQSKLVIIIVSIGFFLGIVQYVTTDKVYKFSSLIQIFQQDIGGNQIQYDLFPTNVNPTDKLGIETIYKSRSYLIDTIEKNRLNLNIEGLNFAETSELIKHYKINNIDGLSTKHTLVFNEEDYLIKDINEKIIANFSYGKLEKNNLIESHIIYSDQIIKSIGNTAVISINNLSNTYKSFVNRFSFRNLSETGSSWNRLNPELIEVSFTTTDFSMGEKVLNFSNENYIEKNIRADSEQARKAINFIDDRLQNVEVLLLSDKQKLQNFKQENKSINVDLEVDLIIRTLSSISAKISEIDLEIAQAENDYTSNNPIFKELLNTKDALFKQRAEIERNIEQLPLAQQEYIDLVANLSTTQNIVSELNNRKLEFSIKEASTIGNMRVIDNAYYVSIVSPQYIVILIYTFLSSILALILTIIRGLYFIPITNPAELMDNNIDLPIFGVIPMVSKEDIDNKKGNERYLQSLQSFVVNIINRFKNETRKKIVITSPSPQNGKSFVSRNLAEQLAELDHKVLLIDLDLKRGDQHKEFDIEKITEQQFLEINAENIQKYKVKGSLYFLPKVSRLHNSFEFINSGVFRDKIDTLQEYFDYIIMDTAPVLSVSDTSVLMNEADINLIITKHALTRVNELKQLIALCKQTGIVIDGVVYNGYEKPSSYYGYYGYYGNYSYQYYAKRYLYGKYDYE